MGHPIRWQNICGVKFYRMGTTLIATKGKSRFVIKKYSCGGGWEASWGNVGGLNMPIGGDVFKTIRGAIKYLRPKFEAA